MASFFCVSCGLSNLTESKYMCCRLNQLTCMNNIISNSMVLKTLEIPKPVYNTSSSYDSNYNPTSPSYNPTSPSYNPTSP